ncbi:lantibiotic dehydratase C-terminal domain-containing protein [Phaeobacter sp.]|uniref:lantibiotic dehydratase C-terminal domain-containing protein n=1 Tax=Phaeobacter sp. TaxID=1902409 RepID=UPI0025D31564|nr:lantibiotic dehydratase C-terminal domain-containing protein [Phaeobacter sp.]
MDQWAAFHLFHAGDLDDVLLQVVKPVIAEVQTENPTLNWFFLRYWNGGPHVRLRVRGVTPNRAAEIGSALQARLIALGTTALDAHAYAQVCSRMDQMRADLPESSSGLLEPCERLATGGTVQRRNYQFDAGKYGNDRVSGAVEEAFCTSSVLSIRALPVIAQARQSRSGVAALFIASGARALAGSHLERADFLDEIATQSADLMAEIPAPGAVDLPPATLVTVAKGDDPIQTTGSMLAALLIVWHAACEKLVARVDAELAKQQSRLAAQALLMDAQHLLMNRLGVPTRIEPHLLRLVAAALRHEPTYLNRGSD